MSGIIINCTKFETCPALVSQFAGLPDKVKKDPVFKDANVKGLSTEHQGLTFSKNELCDHCPARNWFGIRGEGGIRR